MSWTASDIPSQRGRTAVVTGTGGLGLAVASALARAGAEVILAGRNPEKGAAAVAQVTAAVPRAQIAFERLDLASLGSVKEFAERLVSRTDRLDLLVNNAGIMSPPARQTTDDGFELQFGVNHLGHFALTGRLLPLLRNSSAPRVVSVTSQAHRFAKIDFDNLQSPARYQPGVAYCQSKLAQAMFALELQRRSDQAGWGLTSNAAHPGYAATDLFQNGQGARSILNWISQRLVIPLAGQSAPQGALPLLYAATAPAATGGALYGPKGFLDLKGPPGMGAFASAARDEDAAARLWRLSEDLAHVPFNARAQSTSAAPHRKNSVDLG